MKEKKMSQGEKFFLILMLSVAGVMGPFLIAKGGGWEGELSSAQIVCFLLIWIATAIGIVAVLNHK